MKICHLLEHIQDKFPQTSKLSCKLSSIHPGGQASYGSLLSCMNNVVSTTCRKGKPTWEFWLPTSRQLNFGDQNWAWQTSIAQHSGKHRSSLVRSIFGQGQSVCASPVREDLWRYNVLFSVIKGVLGATESGKYNYQYQKCWKSCQRMKSDEKYINYEPRALALEVQGVTWSSSTPQAKIM